jgi:hypothetical protein
MGPHNINAKTAETLRDISTGSLIQTLISMLTKGNAVKLMWLEFTRILSIATAVIGLETSAIPTAYIPWHGQTARMSKLPRA